MTGRARPSFLRFDADAAGPSWRTRHAVAGAALLGIALACMPRPAAAQAGAAIETERLMLSGHGPEDAVPWDFTIDGGRRAGEKATIAVPSNWQQQGFGHYQYGSGNGPFFADRARYHRSFTVPAAWKGKRLRLVFDGVATDTAVTINGVAAGPVHQGGFYRFAYDVTDLVKFGARNDLDVAVSEASAAKDTDKAERDGDYWALSGIFRPVWIEALPREAIAQVAVDARASGDIAAVVGFDARLTADRLVGQVRDRQGRAVGRAFESAVPAGGTGSVRLAGHLADPALWTAETPHLYDLDVTLFRGDEPLHRVRTRFGFRTIEVVDGKGLFVNGRRVLLKGANRHSFRPDTGRSLSRAESYDDVRTLRAMNMNAVRMSHYPPEEAFLEAADELGLYVLDELSGWQHAHDTTVGRRLVRELVDRDVNHPSIVFWDNGNEGGFNFDLDADFARYDPQARRVLHPWSLFDGINTKHYPTYRQLTDILAGPDLVMPTEFLHGLFDGGHGAGLSDYWTAIAGSPRGAGGFLWSFADEGIARTDRGGRIDVKGTMAPDGIVGPWHEPEASVATIKAVWSPVQIATPTLDAGFDGNVRVTNRYDFTDLASLRFDWEWLRFAQPGAATTDPTVLRRGRIEGVALAPHASGVLRLPRLGAASPDAVRLVARRGDEVVDSWVWPVVRRLAETPPVASLGAPRVSRRGDFVELGAGAVTARFDATTGLWHGFAGAGPASGIGGPTLVFDRPPASQPIWTPAVAAPDGDYRPASPGPANMLEIDPGLHDQLDLYDIEVAISPDGREWTTVFTGERLMRDGIRYLFPAQRVAAVRIGRLSGTMVTPRVAAVRLGYQADRFPPAAAPRAVTVTTGVGVDPASGRRIAWLDAPGAGGLARVRWTMRDDGLLSLDYGYRLTGPLLYHGIGFDRALAGTTDVTGLLRGPTPVWKNRMEGPQLGVYRIASTQAPGLPAPGKAGYFADPRWVELAGGQRRLLIRAAAGTGFVQVGAPTPTLPNTTVDFPAGDLGFLAAIPAMGNKFHAASDTGPSAAPSVGQGDYAGTLTFSLSR